MAGSSCAVFVFSLLIASVHLGLGIASIVIAHQDGDNPCTGTDKMGISLKTWNYVEGSFDLFKGVAFIVFTVSLFKIEDESLQSCCIGISVIYTILVGLFTFCWFIIGIVLLARSNGKCVADSTDIGNMTLASLVFGMVGLLVSCRTQKTSSRD